MTDIVKNNRELGGAWAKVRLEGWIRIDESTVQEAAAAIMNPALADVVFKDVEPAETLVLDGLGFFVDTTYLEGNTPDNEGVWSYCPECGNGPFVLPQGREANCDRCGSNWRVSVQ
jgi:hypothetical protein